MRLCVDCTNYVKAEDGEQFDKCNYYNKITPVRGTPVYKYCDLMRDEQYGKCGLEGNFHTYRLDDAPPV